MKLELKTESENYSRRFLNVLRISLVLALIILFCNMSLKLGIISRNYEINYNCGLLTVEKSKSNFKKLSRLVNLKSKQKIWEFCRDFVN